MSPPPEALVERVRRRLAAKGWSASAVSVTEALRDEGLVLPEAAIVEVVSSLRTEIAGLGALEPLVRREGVTDVLVNAPDEVWVDAGQGLRFEAMVVAPADPCDHRQRCREARQQQHPAHASENGGRLGTFHRGASLANKLC